MLLRLFVLCLYAWCNLDKILKAWYNNTAKQGGIP